MRKPKDEKDSLEYIANRLDLLLIIQLANMGFNIKEVGKILRMSSNTVSKLTSKKFSKIPSVKN